MGILNNVKCRNPKCGYHATNLREGPGMMGFARNCKRTEAILNGEENLPEVRKILEAGGKISSTAVYLCPKCRKFVSNDAQFLLEPKADERGRKRNEVSFPFGTPTCSECGTELVLVPNVRSSKTKCPKCGNDMKTRIVGMFD